MSSGQPLIQIRLTKNINTLNRLWVSWTILRTCPMTHLAISLNSHSQLSSRLYLLIKLKRAKVASLYMRLWVHPFTRITRRGSQRCTLSAMAKVASYAHPSQVSSSRAKSTPPSSSSIKIRIEARCWSTKLDHLPGTSTFKTMVATYVRGGATACSFSLARVSVRPSFLRPLRRRRVELASTKFVVSQTQRQGRWTDSSRGSSALSLHLISRNSCHSASSKTRFNGAYSTLAT